MNRGAPVGADCELLRKVIEHKDFFDAVLYKDAIDDWTLAKEFGDFLVKIEPQWVMGYLIRTRAFRHLGDLNSARSQLRECQVRVPQIKEAEAKFLLPLLDQETGLLRSSEG
jgi:hypothetical protein